MIEDPSGVVDAIVCRLDGCIVVCVIIVVSVALRTANRQATDGLLDIAFHAEHHSVPILPAGLVDHGRAVAMMLIALTAAVELSSVLRTAQKDARRQFGYWSFVAAGTDPRHGARMWLLARLVHDPLRQLKQQLPVRSYIPNGTRGQRQCNTNNRSDLIAYLASPTRESTCLCLWTTRSWQTSDPIHRH